MAKRARRVGGGLQKFDLTMLHAELRRRERAVSRLQGKRKRLAARLARLDDEIAALGGAVSRGAGGGSRRRPRNDASLVDALANVLKGKTMGVTEMAEAVQKAGYATSSANFRTIVNATLIKFKDRFKRVERGQYTAK
jgi:hypothetical protein